MPLIITSDMYLLEHLVYISTNASSLNKLLRYTAPKPLLPLKSQMYYPPPLMKMDGTEND